VTRLAEKIRRAHAREHHRCCIGDGVDRRAAHTSYAVPGVATHSGSAQDPAWD